MTSLSKKWLVYTIPIRRTENLNTFTLEEVYETLQNYEFESKGFVDTSASKPIEVALIASMVDNDEIALYKHNHNQILVDELNKSLAINTDLKEAEKIHGRVKNDLGYKVVPHPFSGNFTCSPEHKVDVNHLPKFPLCADPILSTNKPEEEIGSDDERAENISQNVGEFVLRGEVVSERMNDRDVCQFSENTSSSSSDFVEDDDYKVEISSSIIDPITIEPVPVSSEV
ncbi:hypothetical protein L1987_18788 [Smallanthus sonchifolius]|uniref:Uncharacterized protein n=1 Tax=Smallanthus sonchifolius TaxID=185202 RepID=A0ACB9J2R2_9ASTR|nr:hypothetical protein L1987_18788 [Smallanthus sonchifolius]